MLDLIKKCGSIDGQRLDPLAADPVDRFQRERLCAQGRGAGGERALLFRFVLGAGGWQGSHLPRPSTASKPHCLPERPFHLSFGVTIDHSLLRLCWPHLLARPQPSGDGPSPTLPIGQWQLQTPAIPSNASAGDGRTV
jgi:hypothetical protein